jgi:hypothetical protein
LNKNPPQDAQGQEREEEGTKELEGLIMVLKELMHGIERR